MLICVLGEKLKMVGGIARPTAVGAYYVSIIDTLEQLLKDPLLQRHVIQPESAPHGYIRYM